MRVEHGDHGHEAEIGAYHGDGVHDVMVDGVAYPVELERRSTASPMRSSAREVLSTIAGNAPGVTSSRAASSTTSRGPPAARVWRPGMVARGSRPRILRPTRSRSGSPSSARPRSAAGRTVTPPTHHSRRPARA
jgi:hypothetical protein